MSFRERYGSAAAVFPRSFPINDNVLGTAAIATLKGTSSAPILGGEYALLDSLRGSHTMTFEVYSNTHFVFALLYPQRRRVLRKRVRLQWTPDDRYTGVGAL